jgi:hypothetical protein
MKPKLFPLSKNCTALASLTTMLFRKRKRITFKKKENEREGHIVL